jgi:hypothetical protein
MKTNVVGLYSFALQLPEDDTLVPKHVGVLIIVMNCILLSAFVGGYTDCKNMHGMSNKKATASPKHG